MKQVGYFFVVLILVASAFATNYTVKASGGSFTTMAACATQMSTNGTGVSDTCTVFAGTYPEHVTIPAGSAGNYKIFTVNGSDIVSVLGFTLGSHTKVIGNCPVSSSGAVVTTATCGFFVSNTSSPSTGCASLSNGVTDVYIRSNVFYACGTIGAPYPASTSYIYIQGNTVAYTNSTTGTVPTTCQGSGSPVGNSVNLYGDHQLIENNDFSHYTLSVDWTSQYTILRNNVFHDTVEAQNAGNCHSDAWFSEPGVAVPTQNNVIEGNLIQNLSGANAKGILAQADTACGGLCFNLIERFNVSSRIGSGFNSNNGTSTWGHLQVYNNTIVDAAQDCNCITSQGDIDNSEKTTHGSFLNQVYFMGGPSNISGFNMYACSNGATNPPGTAQCTSGHSLYYCFSITCTTVYGPEYEVGTWLGDPGNQVADPKFVNYSGVGNGANNYHLQATSPAIAAGTYLTTVASGDSRLRDFARGHGRFVFSRWLRTDECLFNRDRRLHFGHDGRKSRLRDGRKLLDQHADIGQRILAIQRRSRLALQQSRMACKC